MNSIYYRELERRGTFQLSIEQVPESERVSVDATTSLAKQGAVTSIISALHILFFLNVYPGPVSPLKLVLHLLNSTKASNPTVGLNRL